MRNIGLLLVLVAVSCAPAAPQESTLAATAAEPLATAFLDPSYPTLQAAVAVPDQAASGIQVRLERVWQEGKDLNADVCFIPPDASDWAIWSAYLSSGELMLREFGATMLSVQEPAAGVPGLRCDTLTFVVPPDANLRDGTISIEAIAAYPREDAYCSLYMPKIQQTLSERGIAITLGCTEVNGVLTMQVTGWPPEMTEDEAQAIVYSDEFFSVRGPWTFDFSLGE